MTQRFALIALATLLPGLAGAAEPQFGVVFEPTTAADGSVSVTVRNLSKVEFTLRDVAITAPGAQTCVKTLDAVTVGPGESVERALGRCPGPVVRQRLWRCGERTRPR